MQPSLHSPFSYPSPCSPPFTHPLVSWTRPHPSLTPCWWCNTSSAGEGSGLVHETNSPISYPSPCSHAFTHPSATPAHAAMPPLTLQLCHWMSYESPGSVADSALHPPPVSSERSRSGSPTHPWPPSLSHTLPQGFYDTGSSQRDSATHQCLQKISNEVNVKLMYGCIHTCMYAYVWIHSYMHVCVYN